MSDMPACSSHWEARQDGGIGEKPALGRGVAGFVVVGDHMVAGANRRNSAMPYRSQTTTKTSLHANENDNALALPRLSGGTGETGSYEGKADQPMVVKAS